MVLLVLEELLSSLGSVIDLPHDMNDTNRIDKIIFK